MRSVVAFVLMAIALPAALPAQESIDVEGELDRLCGKDAEAAKAALERLAGAGETAGKAAWKRLDAGAEGDAKQRLIELLALVRYMPETPVKKVRAYVENLFEEGDYSTGRRLRRLSELARFIKRGVVPLWQVEVMVAIAAAESGGHVFSVESDLDGKRAWLNLKFGDENNNRGVFPAWMTVRAESVLPGPDGGTVARRVRCGALRPRPRYSEARGNEGWFIDLWRPVFSARAPLVEWAPGRLKVKALKVLRPPTLEDADPLKTAERVIARYIPTPVPKESSEAVILRPHPKGVAGWPFEEAPELEAPSVAAPGAELDVRVRGRLRKDATAEDVSGCLYAYLPETKKFVFVGRLAGPETKDGTCLLRTRLKAPEGVSSLTLFAVFDAREAGAPGAVSRAAAPALMDKEKLETLVANLASDDWKVREKATKALLKLGKAAGPYLERALRSTDAEVRRRAERIIQKIGYVSPAVVDKNLADLEAMGNDDYFAARAALEKLLRQPGGEAIVESYLARFRRTKVAVTTDKKFIVVRAGGKCEVVFELRPDRPCWIARAAVAPEIHDLTSTPAAGKWTATAYPVPRAGCVLLKGPRKVRAPVDTSVPRALKVTLGAKAPGRAWAGSEKFLVEASDVPMSVVRVVVLPPEEGMERTVGAQTLKLRTRLPATVRAGGSFGVTLEVEGFGEKEFEALRANPSGRMRLLCLLVGEGGVVGSAVTENYELTGDRKVVAKLTMKAPGRAGPHRIYGVAIPTGRDRLTGYLASPATKIETR